MTVPGERPSEQGENQQQTQCTYDTRPKSNLGWETLSPLCHPCSGVDTGFWRRDSRYRLQKAVPCREVQGILPHIILKWDFWHSEAKSGCYNVSFFLI